MFVKSKLFHIYKFDPYHLLVLSQKIIMPSLSVALDKCLLKSIGQNAFYLEVYLAILLIYRESEVFDLISLMIKIV